MSDHITEAEALEDMYPGGDPRFMEPRKPYRNPHKGKRTVDNHERYRCLTTGCNPVLYGESQAEEHATATGHRTAKWPVRSAAGKRKARARNRNGYYDKYNTGAKSYTARKHLIGEP